MVMQDLEEHIRKKLELTDIQPCTNPTNHADVLLDPNYFLEVGLRGVTIALQGPGEYILTHPRALHFVLNLGFNVKEASSLGCAAWLEYGMRAPWCPLS